jgi:hypothetical protein
MEWGWNKCGKGFVPIKTILHPAPDKLIKFIRCCCQSDCSTLKCSCKKNNLECTPAYGHCRGMSCTNSMQMACDENEDEIV